MAKLNTSIDDGKDKELPTLDEVLAQVPPSTSMSSQNASINKTSKSQSVASVATYAQPPKTPSARRLKRVIIDSDDGEDIDSDYRPPMRGYPLSSESSDDDDCFQSETKSPPGGQRGQNRIYDFDYEFSGDEEIRSGSFPGGIAFTARNAILDFFPDGMNPIIKKPSKVPLDSLSIFRSPLALTDKPTGTPRLTTPTLKPSTPKPPGKKTLSSPTKPIVIPRTPHRPTAPTKSDLASKRAFAKSRDHLAASFLKALDEAVTNGALARKSTEFGGCSVVWSKTLKTTAGMFRYRRVVVSAGKMDVDGVTVPVGKKYRMVSACIELAEKVCDDEQRMYSTLAHEFAHAADLIVGENWEGKSHGKGFKQWLLKCKIAFPQYTIELGTCHNYEIHWKYQWQCCECGYIYKRHSKSINPSTDICRLCKSRLVQILPKPRGSGEACGGWGDYAGVDVSGDAVMGGKGTARVKGPSEYQVFMKRRFAEIKRQNPAMQHKELMRIVGQEWRERKENGVPVDTSSTTTTTKTTTVTTAVGMEPKISMSGFTTSGSGLIIIDDSDDEEGDLAHNHQGGTYTGRKGGGNGRIPSSSPQESTVKETPKQKKPEVIILDTTDDEDNNDDDFDDAKEWNLEDYLASLKITTF